MLSNPATPLDSITELPSAERLTTRLDELANGGSPSGASASPASQGSPITPSSPSLSTFRSGHRRQASLGTTKTSPSTRRRSLENTISLIKEVVDGEDPADGELSKLADSLAGAGNTEGSKPVTPR